MLTATIKLKKEGFAGEKAIILPDDLKISLRKSALCRNLYLTDIGYYPSALYHNRERSNGSNEYIFIYCYQGTGWFNVHEKTYEVKANNFFVLPKGIRHKYGADPKNPWTIYWVHFTGELAKEYFHYLMSENSLKPRIAIPSKERNHLFDEVLHYASIIKNKDAVIYANNCLYNYLASFKNIIVAHSESDRKKTDIIDSCITVMKENLDKTLNLYEISQLMDISISHLSALFKEKMHDSPYNHYIFLKIQRACYLLWNSEANIKTIAAELGYEDAYHFSRVFKNMMGLSPKQFRNRDK